MSKARSKPLVGGTGFSTIPHREMPDRIEPSASRAVGHSNGRNRISIIVPCHRVIGANGKLTGYAGGVDKKKWLLAWERRATAAKRGYLFDAADFSPDDTTPAAVRAAYADISHSRPRIRVQFRVGSHRHPTSGQ